MSEENTNITNETVTSESQGVTEPQTTPQTQVTSETQSIAEQQVSSVSEESKDTKKKKNPLPFIVAGVVILAILGVVLYITSDGVRRRQAMEEGDKYLSAVQYEQALASYQAVLDIDMKRQVLSPDVVERVGGIIGEAEELVGNGEYEKAIDLIDKVLVLSSGNSDIQQLRARAEEIKHSAEGTIKGKDYLEQAKQAFLEGRYQEAVELYDLALEALGADAIVEPERTLADRYRKLIELWEAADYKGVAEYVDSTEFDAVIDYMQIENPQYVICKDNLIITLKDNNLFVTGGDLTKDVSDGQEKAVIVTANKYTLFSGQMKQRVPEGEGEFIIWNKGTDISSGAGLKGEMTNGILNGVVYYSNSTYNNIPINISEGKLGIVKTDDHNHFWLSDTDEEGRFYYINEDNFWVDEYVSGTPGYGGTDDIFDLMDRILDTIPPVFTCSAHVNDERFSTSQVKATDNIDGDITSKISVSKRQTGDSWWGTTIYTFTVSDEDGNTAKMTVVVEHEDMCGDMYYNVTSINY